MQVCITGVPVRHWPQLKKPIRKAVERYLDQKHLSYGDVVEVLFFGSYGKEGPIKVAFECPSEARMAQRKLIEVLAYQFIKHAAATDDWFDYRRSIILLT